MIEQICKNCKHWKREGIRWGKCYTVWEKIHIEIDPYPDNLEVHVETMNDFCCNQWTEATDDVSS